MIYKCIKCKRVIDNLLTISNIYIDAYAIVMSTRYNTGLELMDGSRYCVDCTCKYKPRSKLTIQEKLINLSKYIHELRFLRRIEYIGKDI